MNIWQAQSLAITIFNDKRERKQTADGDLQKQLMLYILLF